MGTGYTRQSAATIVDEHVVDAPDLAAEFNPLDAAFSGSTGHSHDGTLGEGQKINLATSIIGTLPDGNLPYTITEDRNFTGNIIIDGTLTVNSDVDINADLAIVGDIVTEGMATLSGSISANVPEDFYSPATRPIFIGASSAPIGYIGINSGYNFGLYWNGYRNTSGDWTSLELGGEASGTSLELSSAGLVVGYGDSVSGNTPTARMTVNGTSIKAEDGVKFVGDASGLTSLPNPMPATSGQNLTDLDADNLASGTIPNGRFPAALPEISGVNLTSLNASNIASGTLASARLPFTYDEAATGSSVVQRTSSSDIIARLFRSEYTSTNASVNYIMTQVATGTSNNYVRPSTPAQVAAAVREYVGFPAGTEMLFRNNSAPTGWTKRTTWNNTALRIVSGNTSASTSGNAFTTAFSNRSVSGNVHATALTIAQMPRHRHGAGSLTAAAAGGHTPTAPWGDGAGPGSAAFGGEDDLDGNKALNPVPNHTHDITGVTSYEGSGNSHDHGWSGSLNMAVDYVDFIIGIKN